MATYPYVPRLDGRVTRTGVYNALADETTWTLPLADETYNCIVLSSDFDDDEGKVVAVANNTGSSVIADGDYSSGEVCLGRKFTLSIELTRPFARARDGAARLDIAVNLKKLLTNHVGTGSYTLRCVQDGYTTQSVTFDAGDGQTATGTFEGWFMGSFDDIRLLIETSDPRPFVITGLRYICNLVDRMN
jgi:hypothetical protein